MTRRGLTLIELLLFICVLWMLTWITSLISEHAGIHTFFASGLSVGIFFIVMYVFIFVTSGFGTSDEDRVDTDDQLQETQD